MTDDARLPFVSVIVPARNAEQTLAECLRSILRGAYPTERREVLVVDNGSADGTARLAADLGVRTVREERRGPAWARNRGIRESAGEIMVFIDADCVATSGWLGQLAAGFDSERVGAVAGEIFAYPPETAAQRYAATRHTHWQRAALDLPRPYPVTANVAFRREVFERVGVFDTAFETAEDKDLGWRFFSAGDMELRYRPGAAVLHRHRRTATDLFRQHAAWGRGAAVLHAKYEIPWRPRHELRMFRELGAAMLGCASTTVRYVAGNADREALERGAFEVVRRAGQRAGALQGMAAIRRTGRPRSAEAAPLGA